MGDLERVRRAYMVIEHQMKLNVSETHPHGQIDGFNMNLRPCVWIEHPAEHSFGHAGDLTYEAGRNIKPYEPIKK